MNPKGVAKLWAEILGGDLAEDERELIQNMTNYILARWKQRAQDANDPEISFRTIYTEEKKHAIGLICAAVEASRAVAAGRNPRDEMEIGRAHV